MTTTTMMRKPCLNLLLLLLALPSFLLHTCTAKKSRHPSLPIDLPSDKKYAYVTLLYSDDFALGVRTLGQSLRETQNRDRDNIEHVVLITSGVGRDMQQWLEHDGWITRRVEIARNPNDNFDERLHGVYTKLEIFRLTEYHRVVYLDADTSLLENVDELFLCGPFCAVMRHSELINTGVVVAEPSTALYTDLKAKVGMGLYSYTGGDQGFLNSYYQDYAACPYFEPMKQIGLGSDGSKCRRLPHRYNGDWPIAMLNGKLEMVRTKNSMQEEFGEFRRSRILHYTFGPFKPWNWYSSLIFPFTYNWTRAAAKLPQTPQDKRQFRKEVLRIVLGVACFISWFVIMLQGSAKHHPSVTHIQQQGNCTCNPAKSIFSTLRHYMTPRHVKAWGSSWSRNPLTKASLTLHLLVGYVTFAMACGVGFVMVPIHTHQPVIGFAIFLSWTFGVFFSLYSIYLYRWYLQGEAYHTVDAKSSPKAGDFDLESMSERSHHHHHHHDNTSSTRSIMMQRRGSHTSKQQTLQSARAESFTYAFGLVLFLVWFFMIRIHIHTVSFGQVLPPLVGGAVALILGLTVVFYRLPLLWYQEGLSV